MREAIDGNHGEWRRRRGLEAVFIGPAECERAGGFRKGQRNSNGCAVAKRATGGGCDSRERKIGDGRYVEPVTCNHFKVM